MKTAEELGLTPSELSSLILVRDLLASGQIEHDPKGDGYDRDRPKKPRFDINVITEDRSCGTTLCIGGWTKLIDMNVSADEHGRLPITRADEEAIFDFVTSAKGGLRNLFYPHSVGHWDRITPAIAVKAIDNVLNSGFPKWRELFKDEGLQR